MKKIYYMLMLLVLANMSKGQSSISPDVSTEQCPSTNINFSVTIPGYNPQVYGWTNGPTVVSANYPPSGYATSTTFTFVGKFRDVNLKQSFRVGYKLPSGTDTSKIFDFTKIKSLFFYVGSTTSCPDLQPNQGTISVPICEIQNKTISFDNIKWQLSGESSVVCFGTITTYEYLFFGAHNPGAWLYFATPTLHITTSS
jgi:hypothetical protein